MEFFKTQETSNPDMVTHIWTDEKGNLHGICVQKDVSIEDAYLQMINYTESDNTVEQ
jgi:hypothetical protein